MTGNQVDDLRQRFRSPADRIADIEAISASILKRAGLPSTLDALTTMETTTTATRITTGRVLDRLQKDTAVPSLARFALTILDRCQDVRREMQAGDAAGAVARMLDLMALLTNAVDHEYAPIRKYVARTVGALDEQNAAVAAEKADNIQAAATAYNAIRAANSKLSHTAITELVAAQFANAAKSSIDLGNAPDVPALSGKTVARYANERPGLFNVPPKKRTKK